MSFDFEARFFQRMLAGRPSPARRVLVVGCGDGSEVAHIAGATGATTIGLDLGVDARARRPGIHLLRADARRLPFRDGTFDALYCYHVLEHVPGPQHAVAESRRVLASSGMGFFGTPNRSRLAGYLGGRATTWEKVKWNLADWGKRFAGRWSNEQGAHAGFTGRELARLAAGVFARVESVSLPYYVAKYPKLGAFVRASFRLGLAGFLMPSVYVRATVEDTASGHR
ncbi:MAG: methyltransferase domain-containing protein [Candidatus Eisenbacteria bacterium]|nr:methyltransferase domain-containing protein [Candidatus Eisenbacteria bacterium]